MKYISRSQWYCQKIEDFLNSDERCLTIDLYSSEITRIEKRYPNVMVSIGPLTRVSKTDQRHSCFIHKKDA